MSGGHFDYNQHRITGIADKIEQLIETNNQKDEWGYSRDYSPEIISRFDEAVKTLRKAAAMAQRIDYLVSGDDGEESFMRRWDKEVLNL